MNFTNKICIYLQAACHKDRSISKRAIEYIQDVITSLLVEQTELPHFHFNEALLKPFENLLSMETCDIDVQVSCFQLDRNNFKRNANLLLVQKP